LRNLRQALSHLDLNFLEGRNQRRNHFGIGVDGWAAGYWIMLVAVRTAGTVMGDFLSGGEGLGLGFLVSAACATFLPVSVLCLRLPQHETTSFL
jgi:hypothetical protein